MVVDVFGSSVKPTEGIKEAAEKEAKKFERYLKPDAKVSVVISVEGDTHKATMSVMYKGVLLMAESKNGDMYAAIGKAADIIERNIRKEKEKKIQRHRTAKEHPLSPEDMPENYADDDEEFVDAEENMPF